MSTTVTSRRRSSCRSTRAPTWTPPRTAIPSVKPRRSRPSPPTFSSARPRWFIWRTGNGSQATSQPFPTSSGGSAQQAAESRPTTSSSSTTAGSRGTGGPIAAGSGTRRTCPAWTRGSPISYSSAAFARSARTPSPAAQLSSTDDQLSPLRRTAGCTRTFSVPASCFSSASATSSGSPRNACSWRSRYRLEAARVPLCARSRSSLARRSASRG